MLDSKSKVYLDNEQLVYCLVKHVDLVDRPLIENYLNILQQTVNKNAC